MGGLKLFELTFKNIGGLTWETNIKQKKLPNEELLLRFFDRIAEECVFQYELGDLRAKEHIQGNLPITKLKYDIFGVFRENPRHSPNSNFKIPKFI